jgi:hypothetical protein
MGRKKLLCKAANGLFMRNLGWKRTAAGYAQHKFYLGRDEHKAALASMRLEELWEQVSKRWEQENPHDLCPTDRPVWDEVTLAVAEAVRNGDPVARVPLPLPLSALVPESAMIAEWLDHLQSQIKVIKIELRDNEARQKSEEQLQKQGQRLLDMGHRMIQRAAGGATLHAALDAYTKWISSKYVGVDKTLTQWGRPRRGRPPSSSVTCRTCL